MGWIFLNLFSSSPGAAAAGLASGVDNRARPEERRRNELYRQYYEELQRRYDSDRPVDCSVIVVNKAQKYVRFPPPPGEPIGAQASSPRSRLYIACLYFISLVCVCVCVSAFCVLLLHKQL